METLGPLDVPDTEPVLIGADTWLVPNLAPAGPDLYIPVNSMVIRGPEPIIVDTGAPLHREVWLEKVLSLVDPEDVRWIFLSHDDGDHTGGLMDVLELCPNATLVSNFFMVERLFLEKPALPPQRMVWLQPGESFHAGDRTIHLFRPPIFDGPTTRGIYDSKTAIMWIVDTFACSTPGPVHHVEDLPRDLWENDTPAFGSLISPWHQWVDPAAFNCHVDEIEGMGLLAVASAHGPIITGDHLPEAFQMVRRLAGQPVIPGPGQEVLDEIIHGILAGSPG